MLANCVAVKRRGSRSIATQYIQLRGLVCFTVTRDGHRASRSLAIQSYASSDDRRIALGSHSGPEFDCSVGAKPFLMAKRISLFTTIVIDYSTFNKHSKPEFALQS